MELCCKKQLLNCHILWPRAATLICFCHYCLKVMNLYVCCTLADTNKASLMLLRGILAEFRLLYSSRVS